MPLHTDRNFEQELVALKETILKMGSLVETMIAQAIKSLVNRDSNMAREVVQQDRQVNHFEVEIDNGCLKLLARYQPTASDLRFVAIGMKISTDLERMGDLAVNICEQVLELNKEELLKPYIDIPELAKKSQEMVRGALDAFVEQDAAKAKIVCESDDEVDSLEYKIFSDLVEMMKQDPSSVSRAIRLIIIGRQLERVADHATNVAEEVSFLVKGQDIRHKFIV